MKKKLLTLDDLYEYYVSKNETIKFNAENDQAQIIVQIPAKLTYQKTNEDTEGLLSVHLQANHTQTNINGSHIEEDVAERALTSFYNRPILGFMHKVNDQWEFWGHNMHEDEDGNIEYDEIPIGVIPESCNAKLVYDKSKKKTYVEVDGYIYEEYSHAAEILQREEECSVSVELAIRELSYNAKERYLDITNYYYQGVTVLGCDDSGNEIKPGMEGSNIRLADFNAENNSFLWSIDEKLIDVLDKLNITLSNFNINNTIGKEENEMDELNFETEEIIEVEEVTEEVTLEEVNNNSEVEENESESSVETPEEVIEETVEETENVTEENVTETESCEKKYTKTFEISHEDVRSALYMLLETFEESDNDWYFIDSVYDDHFNYEGMFTGNIYGQKYIKDGDNVSFDGERYSLHKELLTDSEYAELQAMRSNYSSISEKLEKYETEPQKQEILNSESYEIIFETEEFIELQNNHFDLSVEDVSKKADEILLSYAKNKKLDFSANNKETKRVNLSSKSNIESRYGNLFKK